LVFPLLDKITTLTMTQLLNNYFTSIFTHNSSETLPSIHDSPLPDIKTLSIDVDGVINVLNELDISKAP